MLGLVGGAVLLVAVSVYATFSWKETVTTAEREQRLLEEQSKKWPVYTNSRLGISLKYPREVAGDDAVFFQAGNIVIVTTRSSDLYIRRGELALETDKEILDKFEEIKSQDTHTFPNAGWAIWVRDIHSDSALEQFIQDRFEDSKGDGCKLGKKHDSSTEGIYDIGIESVRLEKEGEPDYPGSCWINWMMTFKYSPQYQRAAMWDIGQEYMFAADLQTNCSSSNSCDWSPADRIMADSFNFVPRSP